MFFYSRFTPKCSSVFHDGFYRKKHNKLRNHKTLLATVIAAAVLSASVATPTFADTSGDTEVTVTLPTVASGTLSITAPASIELILPQSGSQYTGKMDDIIVKDDRKPSSTGWTSSIHVSKDFTNSQTASVIPAEKFDFNGYRNATQTASGSGTGTFAPKTFKLSKTPQTSGVMTAKVGDTVTHFGAAIYLSTTMNAVKDYSGTYKGTFMNQVL